MKVVAIALVLLQASLHSCRIPKTAYPKNDTAPARASPLPSKLIQILESLDSPDAKITKIKQLIPVYNDYPEFRVKSNKKHLFMPYKKKGKPLAYILKKTYVNEIMSEHTDESFDSFEDVKNNDRIYTGKPISYMNNNYYPSTQDEKISEKHAKNAYHDNVKDDLDYGQDNQKRSEIEILVDESDDLMQPVIILPTKHKHVHHTHRDNIENSEEKVEVVSNSENVFDVAAKHEKSNHHHHHLVSTVKLDVLDSDHEPHQEDTEDKLIYEIPKADENEIEEVKIEVINVHNHHHHHHQQQHHHQHHHSESDVSITNTDDNNSLNVADSNDRDNKIDPDEANINPKHDLINHTVAYHTEDPNYLVKIDAVELYYDKKDTDLKHAVEQKSSEKEHLHSHKHSTPHHRHHNENVNHLNTYISYSNNLELVSSTTNMENDSNHSNDTATEAILIDRSPVSKENNDYNPVNFNRIIPGTTKIKNNPQMSSREIKSYSNSSNYSASEYYSDEIDSDESTDASGSSESISEFIDSVSDVTHESTETDGDLGTVSSESENTALYSNELVKNDSYSDSESNSLSSKSLEFHSASSKSESGSESNESDISGTEELPADASNLISESVELSSESDSTSISEESNPSQSIEDGTQNSELSNSGSSENSLPESDKSDSVSENNSKSDLSLSSGYSSQSESEESSQVDSTATNLSLSKESVTQSSENQSNSTVILSLNAKSISSASASFSNVNNLEPNHTDIKLASSVPSSFEAKASYSDPIASSLESGELNLDNVFRSESNLSNPEPNASSIEYNSLLETTIYNIPSATSEETTASTVSIVEFPIPDTESIASNLMASASSLRFIASNIESSAFSLKSVPGLESIPSNQSDLEYDSSNIDRAMGLNSELSTALSLNGATTESNGKLEVSTESSTNLRSNLESNTLNVESIAQVIKNTPSSPPKKSIYPIQTSINNNVPNTVKKELCKNRTVIENKLRSGRKKTYSMSFVFNK